MRSSRRMLNQNKKCAALVAECHGTFFGPTTVGRVASSFRARACARKWQVFGQHPLAKNLTNQRPSIIHRFWSRKVDSNTRRSGKSHSIKTGSSTSRICCSQQIVQAVFPTKDRRPFLHSETNVIFGTNAPHSAAPSGRFSRRRLPRASARLKPWAVLFSPFGRCKKRARKPRCSAANSGCSERCSTH
jgi:hypothetical protein